MSGLALSFNGRQNYVELDETNSAAACYDCPHTGCPARWNIEQARRCGQFLRGEQVDAWLPLMDDAEGAGQDFTNHHPALFDAGSRGGYLAALGLD